MSETGWPTKGMAAKVIWRNDLKSVGPDEVKLALSQKPTEIIVNPRNLDRVVPLVGSLPVGTDTSIAMCEILVVVKAKSMPESPPTVESTKTSSVQSLEIPQSRKKRKIEEKKVPIAISLIEKLHKKEKLDAGGIVHYFRGEGLKVYPYQIEKVLTGEWKEKTFIEASTISAPKPVKAPKGGVKVGTIEYEHIPTGDILSLSKGGKTDKQIIEFFARKKLVVLKSQIRSVLDGEKKRDYIKGRKVE